MKILLVEDNPGDARLVQQMLVEAGGAAESLVLADRLGPALAALGRERFDIVLLDLLLPDSEGLATLQRVLETAPAVPVVVLSGLGDDELAGRAVQAGAQDYLVKGHLDAFWLSRALHYAAERVRAADQLRRLNRALATLSKCNQALVHAVDEPWFLEGLCHVIVEEGGYRLAWIGYAEHDAEKTVRPVACAGFEAGYLEQLRVTWADTERGRGPTGRAIRTRQTVICRDVLTDPSFAPWRAEAVKRGYASTIVLPLVADNQALGALNIYAAEPDAFDAGEASLLHELADDVVFGVASIRTRRQREAAEKEIRKLNRELEERVQQRTAQLAATNESLKSENAERRRAEEEVHQLNRDLERRAAELEAANHELEAFSYSVSHDLRAPLRAIDGFSRILVDEHGAALPDEARRYLGLVRKNTLRMGALIDDLLAFSRLGRQPLNKRPVAMGALARECLNELAPDLEGRRVQIEWGQLCDGEGDLTLLKQVWLNLLANAVKYTRQRENAAIQVGCREEKGERVYFVKDNGVGFDMRYADKLFGVFQRLHRAEDYEGTGVGLAIVQRIIHRHGGRVWAEAEVDQGATFYFTLGDGEQGMGVRGQGSDKQPMPPPPPDQDAPTPHPCPPSSILRSPTPNPQPHDHSKLS